MEKIMLRNNGFLLVCSCLALYLGACNQPLITTNTKGTQSKQPENIPNDTNKPAGAPLLTKDEATDIIEIDYNKESETTPPGDPMEFFGMKVEIGPWGYGLIKNIDETGQAYQKGMQTGDAIIAIENRALDNLVDEENKQALMEFNNHLFTSILLGKPIKFTYRRNITQEQGEVYLKAVVTQQWEQWLREWLKNYQVK
jgi:hypothetical protein